MKISTKTRYGLRFLAYLALYRDKGAIQLGEIAKAEQISNKYLEQIVAQLKPLQILNINRGARGGYALKNDPSEIKLYDIFYTLEGGYEIVPPVKDNGGLICSTQKIWSELQQTVDHYLKQTTLEKIIENYKNSDVMYYI